jgi:hypothetical protein
MAPDTDPADEVAPRRAPSDARHWLQPYRSRSQPVDLTDWGREQLSGNVIRDVDRDRLVAEIHRWMGRRG